jgi:signal transduction histidine kinase
MVTRRQLETTLAHGANARVAQEAEIRAAKDVILGEYRQSEAYKRDVLELLRPDLQRTLGQVHDYKQFVQQIAQNIDVILETRFPGESIDAKLEKAEHEEAAIYWAAQLMDEKLDVALFLLNPDRIHGLRDDRPFRFHGLVSKYWKIYQRQIEAKGLKVIQHGDSYADVDGNSRALAVVVHAFIDNAVKYAPPGSRIILAFEESEESIRFTVESLGPPISVAERETIFDLFVRGEEAARRHADGTGFGLASAKVVATALDIEIALEQDDAPQPSDTRTTSAYMVVPRDVTRRRRAVAETVTPRSRGKRRRGRQNSRQADAGR